MEQIISQLKKLQNIKPNTDYKNKSKLLILETYNQTSFTRFNEIFKFSLALSLTASFLLLIIGGVNYLENSPLPLTITGLNIKTLEAEAKNLKLDITISEIEKYEVNQDNLSIALSQAITDNPIQFESIVLNKETKDVNLNDPVNKDIDNALQKILE